jgi:hypothetical protein
MLESQKRANIKYSENNPEKIKEIRKRYYEKKKAEIRQKQHERYLIRKEIKNFMNILIT